MVSVCDDADPGRVAAAGRKGECCKDILTGFGDHWWGPGWRSGR